MSVGDLNPGCCACGGGHVAGCFATIPDCFCAAIPATLTMTSYDESCNYRMFQSCTLQYGPTPPAFSRLSLGANAFLSTEGFPDPIAEDAIFYYFLFCYHNQLTLTRVYLESPYGSPYRDGALYTWLLGGYGNTCGGTSGVTMCCVNPAHTAWLACVRAAFPGSPDYPTAGPGCPVPGAATPPDAVVAACGAPPPSLVPVTTSGPTGAGFHLDGGIAFPGSDYTCSVTIDGA